jgi:peptidoglycan/LPS O-acetylase OafA/YrhL
MNQTPMKYRKDIQILRGLAVIAVVGYHLKIPGFKNGFLGVDVFFVISGYLMAAIYQTGQTRLFLVRRAKRLLPAFIVTILVTTLVSFFLVVPSDLRQVIDQSKYSLALVPNLYFWSQDSYFASSSFNPLLHLWSLGVEFQFYLFLPILIFAFSKWRHLKYFVFLGSLFSCLLILTISPKTSFFLIPLRFWEFVGGIIAFGLLTSETRSWHRSYTRTIGIALTILSAFFFLFFPINGFSTSIVFGHPGLSSLLTTLLTMVFLVSDPNFRYGSWLETIGKYSYSIYLVHFPLIVLVQYKQFSGTILNSQPSSYVFIQIFVIMLLAKIMYRFVEEPMRVKELQIRSWITILLVTFVTISLVPEIKGFQLSGQEKKIVAARYDRSQYRCGKIFRVFNPSSKVCVIGDNSFNQRILLLGNSHADAIKQTFTKAANKNGKTVLFWVQNDPLMNDANDASEIMKEILDNNISEIYIHYSASAVKVDLLVNFIERVQSKGISVSVIGPVPTWNKSVPDEVWTYRDSPNKSSYLSQSFDEFNERNMNSLFALKSNLSPSVNFFNTGKVLCNPGCRYQDATGVLYYWDSGHLTLSGANVLYPLFLQATRT